MVGVLVSSGCHTKYHRLDGLNNKNVFLTVLEARSLNQGAGEGSLSVFQTAAFPLCPHTAENLVPLPIFIRALIPS